ncbi:hypothetical protein CMV_028093 [Castanea mollissima]|uniref:Uncharacterized protein n=1 Tax=Castanea mollissima TaxID=60419 RepID=A0A8J4Q8E8_9ROSI|nr:hypothetical protein CMV_028093 [Castanea mollissima]
MADPTSVARVSGRRRRRRVAPMVLDDEVSGGVSADLLALQVTQQPAQPEHGVGRCLKKGQWTYCGRVAACACQEGLDQDPG